MYCPVCGAYSERFDGACPECGAPIDGDACVGLHDATVEIGQDSADDSTRVVIEPDDALDFGDDLRFDTGPVQIPGSSQPFAHQAPATFATPAPPAPVPVQVVVPVAVPAQPKQEVPTRSVLPVVLLVVALLAAVGAGAWWFMGGQGSGEAPVLIGDLKPIHVKVEAPGYDADADSPIPLRIAGTTAQGKDIDLDYYLSTTSSPLSLEEGSYTMYVTASPLMSSGELYALPQPLVFTVRADGVQDQSGSPDLTVVFAALPRASITSEQVQAAYDAALASGFDQERAATLRSLLP